MTASGETPLFCDDESRASDPGNRCKLRLRHALLMALVRKKDNPTQGTLQALFGVDQTSVCRYLKVMDRILAAVLPTAKNISKEIAECKTVEGFKKRVPGPDGGDITVDGTHCPVLRPSEKSLRRMRYSGKKKQFTNNTNIYINADGVIIGMSKSFVGSTGDIMLLREDPMPFGRWYEKMCNEDTPKDERFAVYMDLEYHGIKKDLLGADIILPHKKPKKSSEEKKTQRLTERQKIYNKKVGSIRVIIENSIGRIKQYSRMTEPYGGTEEELNAEINIVAGLVNLHLMMTLQRGSASLRKRFLG